MSHPKRVLFCAFALTSLSAFAVDADNTAKNARDENGTTMTADRQMEGSRSDTDITREIRKAIVADDSFSTDAKNVKIITKKGFVNLRGPVSSDAERVKIATIAKNIAGVANVKNALEVKAKP